MANIARANIPNIAKNIINQTHIHQKYLKDILNVWIEGKQD